MLAWRLYHGPFGGAISKVRVLTTTEGWLRKLVPRIVPPPFLRLPFLGPALRALPGGTYLGIQQALRICQNTRDGPLVSDC